MTAARRPAPRLPAFTVDDIVLHVLLELDKRDALPTFGPATLPKACEAAGRLLGALGVEDTTDPLAEVVDLGAYAAARARIDRLGGGS